MAKKRTLPKQKKSLANTCPKKGIFAQPYNPGDDLTLQGLKECLMEAFLQGDHDTVQGSIEILLEKCDFTEITEKTGLSQKALQKMCLPYPPPRFKEVDKIVQFLIFKIQTQK